MQTTINAVASFGDAEILVLDQHQRNVTFRVLQGTLTAVDTFRQHRVAVTPQEIDQAFRQFWDPMWNREQQNEAVDIQCWQSFIHEFQICRIPNFQVEIDMSNFEEWELAIRSLKDGKTPGFDGWFHEEIKLLPRRAIRDLINFFDSLLVTGLCENMLAAKTSLMAKIDLPASMEHGRPITVLPTLYRLYSKIVYQQVMRQWARVLPPGISGGIPARSVRDVAIAQALQVEKSIAEGYDLCGSTMDLTKAFNLLPRAPVRYILERLGFPGVILDFWFSNLTRMTRSLAFAGTQGKTASATTGFAEGDCLSIIAMLSVAILFFY